MEEIKIGEYLRTKKGRIAKATTINNVRYTYCGAKVRGKLELVGTERKVIGGKYELEDIAKHSFNLIDIIEVGDYVNGEYVCDITESLNENGKREKAVVINEMGYNEYAESLFNEDIKTIVTKEQMKSIEYRLE